MSSKDINPSQETLICLIYRHLKDNGYKKAANVLRKHAPQVETGEVKASLSEIYNKWTSDEASKRMTDDSESDSSESSDAPPWPPDVQTPELSPARTNAPCLKKPVNRNIRKTSGSKKQTKKETVTKSKKRKKSGSDDGGSKSHTAAVSITPESDSDSSLDVEKWTKLVSQLSETDIAKMEVLSNFVESPVSLPGTSTEKGKKTKQTKNGTSRTAAQKTKSKTDDISVETELTQTSSKKSKDKPTAAISKGPKSKTSKSPKRTKAKNSKAEKAEMHEPAVNHEDNGLLESWKQDCQNNKSTGKSSNCQIETPGKENAETSSSQTSSKKAKKKKVDGQSTAAIVQTPDKSTDNKVKKKKNAFESEEDHSQDGDLKMASKKAKSKSIEEPVPSETPKKLKAKKTLNPADLDSATSENADVLQESDPPFKEHKSNKSKSLAGEPETPSRKSKKTKSPEPVETPFKTDANPTKGSSKKRRTTCNDLEMELIKSPSKSGKSQVKSGGEDDDGGGTEESSSQDIKTPSKKRKHKEREVNDVSASEEGTPEPKKATKKEAEEVAEDFQQPSEILTSHKKKKKKREKIIESEETAPDDPHVAVAADEVIVHQKKKKRLSRDDAPEPDTDQ